VFERFTKQAREIVRSADAEARQLGAKAIGSEHLLVATVAQMSSGPQTNPWPFVDMGPVLQPVADRMPEPVTAGTIREFVRARNEDAEALAAIGISLDDVRQKVEEALGPGVWQQPIHQGRLRFTDDAKRALELALREALELARREITAETILLGLLREDSEARRVVVALGASPDDAYERLRGSLRQMARLATR
jgi:hypothetical protein